MVVAIRSKDPAVVRNQHRDRSTLWVGITAALVSIAAYLYFAAIDSILNYKDTLSHLEIARRVVDSATPGFAQLGSAWLPLPHLLALPFVWVDSLYYSGFAGSIISMASFVVASVLLYKIAATLTGRSLAGYASAGIFMANPNNLYMQSTPMTELLYFACIAGMVYGVQRWIQTEQHRYLIASGIASLLGTLTRYEAWVLLAVLTVIVIIAAKRKGYSYRHLEGLTLAFIYIAGLGIVAWLVWNLVIFGNPFDFQMGQYSKPSLWTAQDDANVGDWGLSTVTYFMAIVMNLTPVLSLLMVAGLTVAIIRERLALQTLPALSLFALVPFFVVALQQGQRPLHVEEVSGHLYNVRFALLLVIPASIFAGYLVALLHEKNNRLAVASTIAFVGLALAISITQMARNEIITYREALGNTRDDFARASDAASTYLKQHYTQGKVLMQAFGNERVLFESQIPSSANIYEGSYQLWEPALSNPAGHEIKWIVMRRNYGRDQVHDELQGTPLLNNYRLAFSNPDYYIYEEQP